MLERKEGQNFGETHSIRESMLRKGVERRKGEVTSSLIIQKIGQTYEAA